MQLWRNRSRDPAFNLALEEVVMQSGKSAFLLWRNAPSVIIGRHQELNREVATNCQVPVYRRMSGGGAVYHDGGNWNLSWINDGRTIPIWTPLYDAFTALGVRPEFAPPNDLIFKNAKISGAAEYRYGKMYLRHASLLVRTDLTLLARILTPPSAKLQKHGITSVYARVGNLADLAQYRGSADDFGELAYAAAAAYFGCAWSDIDPELRQQADSLSNLKYRTRKWNNAIS